MKETTYTRLNKLKNLLRGQYRCGTMQMRKNKTMFESNERGIIKTADEEDVRMQSRNIYEPTTDALIQFGIRSSRMKEMLKIRIGIH